MSRAGRRYPAVGRAPATARCLLDARQRAGAVLDRSIQESVVPRSSADPVALRRLAAAGLAHADDLRRCAAQLDQATHRMRLGAEPIFGVATLDPAPDLRRYAAAIATDAEQVDDVARAFEQADAASRCLVATTTGGCRALVVDGDLATADRIAIVVGGMESELDRVASDAHALGRAMHDMRPGRTATIAWLDYDVPSIGEVISADDAADGGQRLAEFVRRLDLRPAQQVTLAGHSYGSMVVARAEAAGAGAGRLVLIGSPGLGPGLRSAADLHLPHGGRVYAARAPGDLIAVSAPHGADPSSPSFGAVRLRTNAPDRPRATGHSSYYQPGSESLRNVAAVAVGLTPASQRPTIGERVVAAQGHLARRVQPLLFAGAAGPTVTLLEGTAGRLRSATPPLLDAALRSDEIVRNGLRAVERTAIDTGARIATSPARQLRRGYRALLG
jgi:hypothetical protein